MENNYEIPHFRAPTGTCTAKTTNQGNWSSSKCNLFDAHFVATEGGRGGSSSLKRGVVV